MWGRREVIGMGHERDFECRLGQQGLLVWGEGCRVRDGLPSSLYNIMTPCVRPAYSFLTCH